MFLTTLVISERVVSGIGYMERAYVEIDKNEEFIKIVLVVGESLRFAHLLQV